MTVIHCVITKEFTFRGKPERWSNGYNLQTTATIDSNFLKSVCDALVNMEKTFMASTVKFPYRVAGILGQPAIYSEEVASPPTGAAAVSPLPHQEVAVLAQAQFGPKKYVMKYYHHSGSAFSSGLDDLSSSDKTRVENAIVKLTDGTLPGSATYCRPNGALITTPFKCDPYLRVHQLKRRGKRKA
jgi:hypothetical protein